MSSDLCIYNRGNVYVYIIETNFEVGGITAVGISIYSICFLFQVVRNKMDF